MVKKWSGINKDFGKLQENYNKFKYWLMDSIRYELDKTILCINDYIDIYTYGFLRGECVFS